MLLFWQLLLTIFSINAEVITLNKDNNITCVLTSESVYSSLLLNQKVVKRERLEELTDWIEEDWSYGNSETFLFSPVTDIRWEEFEEFQNRNVKIENRTISFSLCLYSFIIIRVFEPNHSDAIYLNQSTDQNFCQWSHYSLYKNQVLLLQNDNILKKIETIKFIPQSIAFQNNVQGKLHKYDFKFAGSISLNDQKSYVNISNISNSSNICIAMFISVDKDCVLDIILESKTIITRQVDGFNENDVKTWKRVEIETDMYNGSGQLIFYRTRRDNKIEGFWAIDKIHLCKPKTEVYRTTANEKLICKTLEKPKQTEFCQKNGFLGKNCTVKCENILGKLYSFCQEHKICLNQFECSCAWGFSGRDCKQTCQEGFWGLDCKSKINSSRCQNYNTIEGCTKCREERFGDQCSKKFPVVLRAPELKSIKNDFIEIEIDNLNYGRDEARPQYYQIQYKEVKSSTYLNATNLKDYPPKETDRKIIISDLSTEKFEYSVRVILVHENEFFDEPPELVTSKKSLSVHLDENLDMKWNKSSSLNIKSFVILYNCSKPFCSKQIFSFHNRTTENRIKIANTQNFSNCVIKLQVEDNSSTIKLLDEAEVKLELKLSKQELPKNISLIQNKISLRFGECSTFYGPIIYILKIVCMSELCQNNSANITISLGEYTKEVNKTIPFIPFGTYNIEVTAQRNKDVFNSNYTVLLPIKDVRTSQIQSLGAIIGTQTFFIVAGILVVFVIISLFGAFFFCKRSIRKQEENFIPLLPIINQSKTIKVDDLEQYLKNNNLTEDFNSLTTEVNKSCSVGLKKENVNKNRHHKYVPYDETRVCLRPLKGVGHDDYINASYIKDDENLQIYIACQAPKFNTVSDFWRMIWQEEVDAIFMATDFFDVDGNRLCAEYWPNKECEYGDLVIKVLSEDKYKNYEIRTFELIYLDRCKRIEHFFLKWKPNAVTYVDDILPVVKHLKRISDRRRSPIVVHSNYGINRNITLILCIMAIKMGEKTRTVNFYDLLLKIAEQKPHVMEDVKYYILAHFIVLEYFLDKKKPLNKTSEAILKSNLDEINDQIDFIKRIGWHDEFIKNFGSTNNFLVSSYRLNFLCWKQPLNNSAVQDFWTLIKQEKINTVVSLNNFKENLFPFKMTHNGILIQVEYIKNYYSTDFYKVKKFLLRSYDKDKILDENIVTLIQLQGWNSTDIVPKSKVYIIKMLDFVKKKIKEQEKVLVMCSDGLSANGLFIILFYALEQYENELNVDISKPLRIMKRSYPKFTIQSVQVQFIYGCILEYLQNYDLYDHLYN